MAIVSARNYLGRILREAFRQTLRFSQDSAWQAAIAVAAFLFQVINGTSRSIDFRGNALATLWAFGSAILVYLAAQFVRAPLALDRERFAEIDRLKKLLGEMVSVSVDQISFRHPTPNLRNVTMVVHLSLGTADTPATLYDLALHSQSKPELKPVVVRITGLGQHEGGNKVRLYAHHHDSGAVFFDFSGVAQMSEDELRNAEHRWTFEFRDAHRPYSIEIPKHLYVLEHQTAQPE